MFPNSDRSSHCVLCTADTDVGRFQFFHISLVVKSNKDDRPLSGISEINMDISLRRQPFYFTLPSHAQQWDMAQFPHLFEVGGSDGEVHRLVPIFLHPVCNSHTRRNACSWCNRVQNKCKNKNNDFFCTITFRFIWLKQTTANCLQLILINY